MIRLLPGLLLSKSETKVLKKYQNKALLGDHISATVLRRNCLQELFINSITFQPSFGTNFSKSL